VLQLYEVQSVSSGIGITIVDRSIQDFRQDRDVTCRLEARSSRQAQESRALGANLRDIYDADFDGPADLPLKKAPTTGAPRLLIGITLMSLVWAATSILLFIRAEPSRRSAAHLESSLDVPAHPVRPPTVRPLFADIPAPVWRKGLPGSEVSLASDVRAAEERGGDALWTSHDASFVYFTQTSASDGLKRHVSPGREIDGWLMKVNWSILRGPESVKYNYTGFPPVYELNLRFPEDLAGHAVCLWGHNYDFGARKFTCPNEKVKGVKDGDWVRVFGVLRTTSRIDWEPSKSDERLSLGEMIISDIRIVDAIQE
jgi:hypothetical protein